MFPLFPSELVSALRPFRPGLCPLLALGHGHRPQHGRPAALPLNRSGTHERTQWRPIDQTVRSVQAGPLGANNKVTFEASFAFQMGRQHRS